MHGRQTYRVPTPRRLPQPALFPVFRNKQQNRLKKSWTWQFDANRSRQVLTPRLVGSFAGLWNLLALRRPTGKIGGPPISASRGVNWTRTVETVGGVASWNLGCSCKCPETAKFCVDNACSEHSTNLWPSSCPALHCVSPPHTNLAIGSTLRNPEL